MEMVWHVCELQIFYANKRYDRGNMLMYENSKKINTYVNLKTDVTKMNGKKISILQVVALYTFMLAIYWMNGSPISLACYLAIGVWSYFNPLLLLCLSGASNYLPAVLGLSPLLISMGLMVGILLLHTKKIRILYTNLDLRFIMLFIIVIWSMLSGILQQDMSFMSSMITAFICYILLRLYLNRFEYQNKSISYLATGIGFGIILALFIQFGISGFESFHPFRLAIGERADPNSTGLLMAIFCIYSFVQFTNSLSEGIKNVIPYLFFILFGLWVLLLTQSRGSVLCVGIVIVIYLLFAKNKKFGKKGIFTILGLCLCVTIILIFAGDVIFGTLWESFNQFVLRIETSSSSDGERLYLLEKSFESFVANPIFGISLNNFEIIAGHIPHNTFSDYMVTNGIVGIIFFVIMYAMPIISMYPSKRTYQLNLAYFCYFVCFLNILFYSASNEKITIILLVILMHSIKQENYNKQIQGYKGNENRGEI